MPSSRSRSRLAGLVSLAFASTAAAGDVPPPQGGIVNFVETATGVSGSFSGSLNVAGLVPNAGNPVAVSTLFNPGIPRLVFGHDQVDAYGLFPAVAFGTNVVSGAPNVVGSNFGLFDGEVRVPAGYTTGSYIMGTVSFGAGSTFASLGITAGTYALILAALGMPGFVARRQRAAAHAVA